MVPSRGFGDLTRGLVNLASERGRRVAGRYDDRNDAPPPPTVTTVAVGSVAGALGDDQLSKWGVFSA